MTNQREPAGLTGPRIDPLLRPHAAAFYLAYDHGPSLVSAIVRSGWIPSYFQMAPHDRHLAHRPEAQRPPDWLIRARPPKEIADSFDLQVEVLFYVSSFLDLQARTVQRVREYLHADPRASRDIAFLVTGDSRADEKITQIPRADGIVPLSWAWVENAADGVLGPKPLRGRLERFLYSKDLFDVHVPVVGHRFFGRQTSLQVIKRNALGDQPVGLFGLRKIGKTSLLKSFIADSTAWVPGEPVLLPVHLDLQALPSGRRDQTYLLWEIGRRSLRAARSHPVAASVVIPGRFFASESPPSAAFDVSVEFDRDLRALIDGVSSRAGETHLILVLDEIERLVPPTSPETPLEGAISFLRYLRGLNQEGVGMAFILAGANPYLAEQGLISGQENPLLNFIVKHYLPPLTREETTLMLQRLGGMMGVRFHHEAASLIVQHTGGHPYLARQLASVVIRSDKRERPFTVEPRSVEIALGPFSMSQHHTFQQILDSLAQYPDEQFLLRQLARGDVAFLRDWVRTDPLSIEHLEGYGLIEETGDSWEFRIPLFGEFVANAS